MANYNPKPSLNNLIHIKKGQVLNPNGRPKKFVSTLKEKGYKLSEINDTIQVLLALNLDELKLVYEDKNTTVLEKTISAALKKSIEKGDLNAVETLLTRVYGRARQEIDINTEKPIQIILPPNDKGSDIQGFTEI